ncbi:MAG: (2Fe-2S)-binding protein [Oligoflexus sp.]
MSDENDDRGMPEEEEKKRGNEDRIKQLTKIVCICKGIPLSKVLEGLEGSETVADVNRKVGTGSGGCQGERCGPRIKILLRKYKEHKSNKKD